MKQFDINLIRPTLPFRIAHKTMTMPSVDMFLSRTYKYTIDYDVYLEDYGINLQRGFVWTESQKQEFVISILKGVNIPQFAIVVYTPPGADTINGERVYKIIDGKQRLSAIIGFCKNEFPIPCGRELFFFHELPQDIQDFILSWEGQAQMTYSYHDDKISDKGLVQWFWLLNFAGTQQDREHIEFLTSKL